MSVWDISFEQIKVGEEFSDLDGDIFEKTSQTEAECLRSVGGGRCDGDIVDFHLDAKVTLLNNRNRGNHGRR